MIKAAPKLESLLPWITWRSVDLFELPFPTYNHTSLYRAQGEIAWSVDKAAFELYVLYYELYCQYLRE